MFYHANDSRLLMYAIFILNLCTNDSLIFFKEYTFVECDLTRINPIIYRTKIITENVGFD